MHSSIKTFKCLSRNLMVGTSCSTSRLNVQSSSAYLIEGCRGWGRGLCGVSWRLVQLPQGEKLTCNCLHGVVYLPKHVGRKIDITILHITVRLVFLLFLHFCFFGFGILAQHTPPSIYSAINNYNSYGLVCWYCASITKHICEKACSESCTV